MAAMVPPIRAGAAVRAGATALGAGGALRWPKAKLARRNGKIQKAANRTARVRIKQLPSQTKRHTAPKQNQTANRASEDTVRVNRLPVAGLRTRCKSHRIGNDGRRRS